MKEAHIYMDGKHIHTLKYKKMNVLENGTTVFFGSDAEIAHVVPPIYLIKTSM